MAAFDQFGLAEPILAALSRAGFTQPTPIQALAIPPQMQGRDVLGIAETGTGKTAAFGLPIVHAILAMKSRPAPMTARALILAPTRELAVQIEAGFRQFAGGARLSTCLVLGGVSAGGQVRKLAQGVDVLVATPGRLTDLLQQKKLRLDETLFAVLDEADRMLDMGFVEPVRRILKQLHPRRRSALFSATMPAELRALAESFLSNPVRVEAAPAASLPALITEKAERVEGPAKRARLAALLRQPEMARVIVFTRTKRGADRVGENLGKDGIEAGVIHGNKAQNARQRALGAFRAGTVPVLVATDIVARGIDVPGISHVINFDLPDEPESYVHRIGRTGRNGARGTALTLVAPDEMKKLRAIEKLTGTRLVEGSSGSETGQGPKPARPQAPLKPGSAAKPGSTVRKFRPPRWRGKRPPRKAA